MFHLARAGGNSGPNADRAANLHTGFRALDFNEPRTVGRAGIPGGGCLPGQILRWMFGRLRTAFGLRHRRRNREDRDKERKKDVSHPALLSRAPRIR